MKRDNLQIGNKLNNEKLLSNITVTMMTLQLLNAKNFIYKICDTILFYIYLDINL